MTRSFEGARKETRESTGSLAYLFPIALLLVIYVHHRGAVPQLRAADHRDEHHPLRLIGAVIGHVVMGFPITLLSMIGIVALSGIVVNDGLILVDLANRKRREGLPLFEAVAAARAAACAPILLTSITTCVGPGPIMLETSFQAQFLIPMAVSIVFGTRLRDGPDPRAAAGLLHDHGRPAGERAVGLSGRPWGHYHAPRPRRWSWGRTTREDALWASPSALERAAT